MQFFSKFDKKFVFTSLSVRSDPRFTVFNFPNLCEHVYLSDRTVRRRVTKKKQKVEKQRETMTRNPRSRRRQCIIRQVVNIKSPRESWEAFSGRQAELDHMRPSVVELGRIWPDLGQMGGLGRGRANSIPVRRGRVALTASLSTSRKIATVVIRVVL